MKKKYIALIMIVMAACFGTLALPSPAAKPAAKAADTTVSVAYLQQIEQQNQRMADSVALLRMEQQLAEYVEKKAEENRNYSLGIFGACMTLITCAIGFLGIFLPWKSNDKLRKKLDATAKRQDATAKRQDEMAKKLDETEKKLDEKAKKLDETEKKLDEKAKKLDETEKKLDETVREQDEMAKKSKQAFDRIAKLETKIQENLEQVDDSAQEPKDSDDESKTLTYFMQALKEEDLDLKIERYTQAIEIDPDDFKAYNNRGNAYDDMGEYDQAIADYTEAIKIDPNHAMAYSNRGFSKKNLAKKLDAEGKTAEALGLYNAAVKECDEALKRTQDDNVRKIAILLKQECEEAIERLEGGKK